MCSGRVCMQHKPKIYPLTKKRKKEKSKKWYTTVFVAFRCGVVWLWSSSIHQTCIWWGECDRAYLRHHLFLLVYNLFIKFFFFQHFSANRMVSFSCKNDKKYMYFFNAPFSKLEMFNAVNGNCIFYMGIGYISI